MPDQSEDSAQSEPNTKPETPQLSRSDTEDSKDGLFSLPISDDPEVRKAAVENSGPVTNVFRQSPTVSEPARSLGKPESGGSEDPEQTPTQKSVNSSRT